jgi:hypothetical protein
MHDAGCPLRELDPRTSDPNVGGARGLEGVLDGARAVRDRLDAVLARVEHRVPELPALHMIDEEAFDLGLLRWASWTTNDERHVMGFVDLPDGKTDPRLALFELCSRADAMFVVDLLKRVGAQPMAVSVEKLRELRIASEAVAETEGSV